MDSEVVKRLKEAAVIASFGASPGAGGGKHPQHRRPIVLPVSMVEPPEGDPPWITDRLIWKSAHPLFILIRPHGLVMERLLAQVLLLD